ncbi:hypothetical protein LCGC14_1296490, partial [marine sediment metagenome]
MYKDNQLTNLRIGELKSNIDEILLPILKGYDRVAIFDFPNYANVGDSAIWLGQESFLAEHDIFILHVDDCYHGARGYPKLPSDVAVLINGGGNFGDIYPRHQKLRELLISQYPNHRIIQLPQSIHFQRESEELRCADSLKLHSDFHLIVRDEASFNIAKRIHSGHSYLCPDMAFYLKKTPRMSQQDFHILGLLRTDCEQKYEHDEADQDSFFCDWVQENRNIFRVVNWASRFDRRLLGGTSSRFRKLIYSWAANLRLRRGCLLLSSGQVVITDRLHAHVLCTIMGIPHVVLDNTYG